MARVLILKKEKNRNKKTERSLCLLNNKKVKSAERGNYKSINNYQTMA
ncbi:MAG: hypothetical protein SXA11_17640 [Cyanobacteriota bacterium]|nr:hypothetical protein [Cyanobacteriota bacterium]